MIKTLPYTQTYTVVVYTKVCLLQAGPWSDSLEVVSGPGVPDPPKMPAVSCRSPHCATITWEEPVNNGARITDYRLEWQQRTDTEFVQVGYLS